MVTKIFFVGNPLGGDDGIGPFLYNELKDDSRLKDNGNYELLELGVIGLDMINYVTDGDNLIIVDAVYSNENVGEVILVDEKGFESDLKVASMHDFGVEETVKILENHVDLKSIKLIGVKVRNINKMSLKLSDEIMQKKDSIIDDVVRLIKKCV